MTAPAPVPEPDPDAAARFFQQLESSLAQQRFVKLTLAKPTGAAEPDLQRWLVRPLSLRGEPCLSIVARHDTRDLTRNLPLAEGLQTLRDALGTRFKAAHLRTLTHEAELVFSKKGKSRLTLTSRAGAPADAAQPAEAPPAHDRRKQRMLTLDQPFLAALGVTTDEHRLVPAMARKWKQINKFVEVFSHALAGSALAGDGEIHVVDFGSGKGYLTFAMHDHLQALRPGRVRVTGVELRPDMVALCNDAARRLALDGLHFEQGDIRSHQPPRLDVMIALHACDTATDHAIHLGVRSGAAIIMCSPCCHKQLRPQLLSPQTMRPILRHGVHLGQQAEMLTDGLRAMLLEACGYDTQVFEFVSLEHTNKNKMILALKRGNADAGADSSLLAQVHDLKAFYGIRDHCLESLLRADGRLG